MKVSQLQLILLLLAGSIPGLLLPAARAQTRSDLDAFVGRWRIDLERTRMGRGNHITRASTFSFVFERSGEGLTLHTYSEYPQATPTRSNTIVTDHKRRSCETKAGCLTAGGNPDEQSYAYYQIDPLLMMRVFFHKDAVEEYSTYAVSSDGKTFTMIAWGAEAPDRQNIQVFDKQPETMAKAVYLAQRPRSALQDGHE